MTPKRREIRQGDTSPQNCSLWSWNTLSRGCLERKRALRWMEPIWVTCDLQTT